MFTELLSVQIARAARQHGLPIPLVNAIVEVESDGNLWAVRYEPAFFDRYISGHVKVKTFGCCSLATENRLRACSFGPMQIMGQVARERGFEGEFLTQLCDPEIGLEYGCRHLALLADRIKATYGYEGVIAAYNAGSPRKQANDRWINEGYVRKVIAAGGLQ